MASPNTALKLISSLGGHTLTLNEDEVDRLNSSEDGKALLTWIASLSGPGERPIDRREHVGLNGEGTEMHDERRLYAALRGVMLEPEELDRSKRLLPAKNMQGSQEHQEKEPGVGDYQYLTPSQSKKHAELVELEIKSIQEETDVIHTSIGTLKTAGKNLKKRNKLLERAESNLDIEIRNIQEQLSDLSTTIDCTLQSSTAQSEALLKDLGSTLSSREKVKHDPQTVSGNDTNNSAKDIQLATETLKKCNIRRLEVTEFMQGYLDQLELLKTSEKHHIIDAYSEGARLRAAFSRLRPSRSSEDTEEEYEEKVMQELSNICALLETEADKQDTDNAYQSCVLAGLLSEVDSASVTPGVSNVTEIDIEDRLRRAWRLDQMAAMRQHESHLDQATSHLEETLEPLGRMYSRLAALMHCMQEAEAVMEATVEELGDIRIPASGQQDHAQKRDQRTETAGNTDTDEKLDRILMRSLGKLSSAVVGESQGRACSDLQGASTSSSETSKAKNMENIEAAWPLEQNLDTLESEWVQEVLQMAFTRLVHPALTHVYSNSPWNTSPPFSFPEALQDLCEGTRQKVNELQTMSKELDAEVWSTFADPVIKKHVAAMVDRWSQQ